MNDIALKLEQLTNGMKSCIKYFLSEIKQHTAPIQIFTHIDADGIASGAILGKALYRENLPFQITILRQLEREEIEKIVAQTNKYNNFIIFADFGSGQYLELQKKLQDEKDTPFIILDHHLPQTISNKEEFQLIEKIRENTSPWHLNPYFYGIEGSTEISGAGMSYFFAKSLNQNNTDLSPIAIVGATGDIQNQAKSKSFIGTNLLILEDAKKKNLIEVVNDLNFSSIKPINEAIAYSKEFNLPGLSNDVNRTLKFLQTTTVLMEDIDGNIRSLNMLNQDEKQKISTAIIEYATIKLNIEPSEIIEKLIVNKYFLTREQNYIELNEASEFANILNSCGRSNNGSIGIALAMGDRDLAYKQAKEILNDYKKLLFESLKWIYNEQKIQSKENIQYFFGDDKIPESIIGVVASILIFDKFDELDLNKPVFGIARREDEEVFKISGRAHESIVNKGINLSDAIRKTLEILELDMMGGGHPPAAGTKVPFDKIESFLEIIDSVIKNQIS
ncbi:MAG: DHHA1 domain-containing protein [Promethearchaeota archaeon]